MHFCHFQWNFWKTDLFIKNPTLIFQSAFDKRGTKDTRGTVKLINRNKLTTLWLKMKKTNRQTKVHLTQHKKLTNRQHEPHQKLGVISGAPEG